MQTNSQDTLRDFPPHCHHHIFPPFPSPFLSPLPLFSVTIFRAASLCCYAFILTYFCGPEIAPGGCSGPPALFWGLENEVYHSMILVFIPSPQTTRRSSGFTATYLRSKIITARVRERARRASVNALFPP